MKQLKLKFILFVIMIQVVAAAQAQPQQPHKYVPQGLIEKLIEIKYTGELYLTNSLKKENASNEKDSVLAIYNNLRLQLDGFVYALSAQMIAENSPRKFRMLNDWCLLQKSEVMNENEHQKNIEKYKLSFIKLDHFYRDFIVTGLSSNTKTLNLTTNVFYLLKDSYTIVKGLNDMKTQKVMALIEILDHTRLMSPGELIKNIK